MDSSDNQKGLALAMSSSAFIGASFIVKKKGLMRARASGRGAGDGGYAYLRESLWWIGLMTMIFGEIANFTAYAYAPAILVTPLGALSVLVAAVLASFMLDEKLNLLGKIGCGLSIVGSTVVVINAPAEGEITSVTQITDKIVSNLAFQFYVLFVVIVVCLLVFRLSPHHGRTNVLIYIAICSLVGSLSVIAVKGLGIALKLTFGGKNQLTLGATWLFLGLFAGCVVMQMNYLNKALDTFSTAVVTPIYYVMFTTFTIIASALLFRGWGDDTQSQQELLPISIQGNCSALQPQVATSAYTAGQLVTCLCGFITICAGVFVLQFSKDPVVPVARAPSPTSFELASVDTSVDDEARLLPANESRA